MSRPSKQQVMVDRYVGDLRIIEPKQGIILVPNAKDVRDAVQGDPCKCAVALTARRTHGATFVFVFARVAYMDIVLDTGERVAARFQVPARERAKLNEFDRFGTFPVGGFRLAPVRPSMTLKRQREDRRKTRAEVRKGERKPVKRRFHPYADPLTVRSHKGFNTTESSVS